MLLVPLSIELSLLRVSGASGVSVVVCLVTSSGNKFITPQPCTYLGFGVEIASLSLIAPQRGEHPSCPRQKLFVAGTATVAEFPACARARPRPGARASARGGRHPRPGGATGCEHCNWLSSSWGCEHQRVGLAP